ncbi:MAG: DMT family transporter [Hadesarchaea archaeon]|nr:DMT family transporter [Hadesarchaea archaeon]
MQVDLIGALAGIFSAIFFAVSLVYIRRAMTTGDPVEATFGATGVSALMFLPFLVFYFPDYGLDWVVILAFVASGISANFIGRIFFYAGTQRVGASRTMPISRGNLLVAALLGIFVLGEVINLGHFAGILVLTGGLVLVGHEIAVTPSSSAVDSGSRGGRLLDFFFPVGAMFLLGFAVLFDKIGLGGETPFTVGLAIKFSAAAIGLIIFMLVRGDSPIESFRVEEKWLYFGGGVTSGIALGFLYFALNISRVVVVIPFYSLSPLFMLIFSHYYLERLEEITKILVFGTILVVLGALLTGVFM